MDPYTILGINQSSTEQEIKTAYRNLVRIHHPDKGGTAEKFKEINEAYIAITKQEQEEDIDIQDILNMFNIMRKGRTVISELELTIEEIEKGGTFNVQYRQKIPTGKMKNTVVEFPPFGQILTQTPEEIEKIDYIDVIIPPCWDTNKPLLFNSIIESPKLADLELRIRQKEHKVKRISRLDIQVDIDISLSEALTGFTREIHTLSNRDPLKLECNSIISPNDTKRIEFYGLSDGTYTGDLIIKFYVIFPVLLSPEVKEKLREILV